MEGPLTVLKERLAVARGDRPADLVLRGGQLVDVLAGEIYPADVAVLGDTIVGVGSGYSGTTELDCTGRWIAPAFIDGHMHVESSLVTLPEFARAVLPKGTVTVVLDPHEIANVHGVEGIRYILESRRGLPLRTFVMASSCVPATGMETAGAELSVADLAGLMDKEGVLGLAEMMNFPGVVRGDPDVVSKLEAARARRDSVDGTSTRTPWAARAAITNARRWRRRVRSYAGGCGSWCERPARRRTWRRCCR
jgi:adenine deaminase